MKITKSTARYEKWLGRQLKLIPADLDRKHQSMAEGPFPFLRATFYRWAQVWPSVCSDLASAPRVLSVGDLHVENFGTWRDIEGRLVWGINDFDEAYPLPYASDLVRLATSAALAIAAGKVQVGARQACDAILAGYRDALACGGRPYVLAESHPALREMARARLREPEAFWARLDHLEPAGGNIPAGALKGIRALLPERLLKVELRHRTSGLGSLGRQRVVAVGDWSGGRTAREAKALAPSACCWALGLKRPGRIRYQDILDQAVRCPDPFVRLRGRWLVRRLAPDCSRIEFADLPRERDERRLLHAMGFETANVHLGDPKSRQIAKDLARREPAWLHHAARQMAAAVEADWKEWRESVKKPGIAGSS